MNPYLEIATSLESKSVTFLLGTGFSRFLTNNSAPNWFELILEATNRIDEDGSLVDMLFRDEGSGLKEKFELSICAQMLDLEYAKRNRDLKTTVCEIIFELTDTSTIERENTSLAHDFFQRIPEVNLVTTNYDTLLSDHVLTENRRLFVDGSIFSKMNTGRNIYHIHGSVISPHSLVLTMDDYFNFQHRESFLSRKFFTLLQETTIVIMGYSLGDFNLNSILHESQMYKGGSFRRSDIYYVTRDEISNLHKRFYFHTYGIQVIDQCEIDTFMRRIFDERSEAERILDKTSELEDVLCGNAPPYSDEFLRLRNSIPRILIAANTMGMPLTNLELQNLLVSLLDRKMELTTEYGAWAQYAHLAEWLVEILSLIDIAETDYRDAYLRLIQHSISHMSRAFRGYSWEAFEIWTSQWENIQLPNRVLIKELIESELPVDPDAAELLDL